MRVDKVRRRRGDEMKAGRKGTGRKRSPETALT
jgi:hypothetical protein